MSQPKYPRQLLLDLGLNYPQTFANFIVGGNSSVCKALIELDPFDLGYENSVCCWSETSSGKSHLLAAYCAWWQDRGIPIHYINHMNFEELNVERVAAIAFDDLQNFLMIPGQEENLLRLLLQCYEQDVPIICSANKHPTKLDFTLDDLATRFASFFCFKVLPLKGQDLLQFAHQEAEALGLSIKPKELKLACAKSVSDIKKLGLLLRKLADSKDQVFNPQKIDEVYSRLSH